MSSLRPMRAILALLAVPAVLGITLPIPSSPPSSISAYLSPSFASFSIEFAFFPTFIGNASSPNTLTLALLGHITDRAGQPPSFRPGGITVDSSIYDSSAGALDLDESSSGGIYRTTYGPDYFQSLALLDNRTQFLFDLNFGNNSLDIALDEAQAAFANVPASQLYAFELGNEPDQYNSEQRDTSTWNAQTYTTQWVNWTSTIQSTLGLSSPSFVALDAAEDPTSSALITTQDVVIDGITQGGTVKAFSQHMYQYSTCDPTRNALATLPNLIDHGNITTYVDEWLPQIAAAQSVGVPFIVGEFNSVSCSGKAGVTDTFGQALWIADTMLHGASVNISKMFLHQGATLVFQSSDQVNTPGFSYYDTWFPVPSNGTDPHASPSYVAFLLLAEAIGSSNRSRVAPILVPDTPTLGAYAIWDDALNTTSPSRVVLLNLDIFDVASSSPRPSLAIDLSPIVGAGTNVTLKRMTAPGLDETDPTQVTWAGQQFYNGSAVGSESVESVGAAGVEVMASEGVLVFLSAAAAAGSGTNGTSGSGGSGGSGSGGSSTSGARRRTSVFGSWRDL